MSARLGKSESEKTQPPEPTSAPDVAPSPAILEPTPIDPAAPPAAGGIDAADRAQADLLVRRLKERAPMGAAEVLTVEKLLSRYPNDRESLLPLVEGVFVGAADGHRRARRFPEAAELLRRAAILKPDSMAVRSILMNVLLEGADWPAAEAAARELLALFPGNPNALRGLGQALMRQDRNREAAEALRASLEVEENAAARKMLAHVDKGLRDETGMSEKQLAQFHVRYDGNEHGDVGREILRALERHFATLTGVFDHRPESAIPVILFSSEAYYDAAGAPRWSGGAFNHFDGRIRIPIGGLTSSLTPDIDDVLVHELSHAFVADISRGICPRDVHEGLAQYMEGKRIATELSGQEIKALADGRIRGVSAFYFSSLAFVEHLIGQRGQGGMNDLLRAMGEKGDVNAAFQQVYGQDHRGAARAFSDRLRLQYGS
jgi:tetratricopeptide (TPR) repeat protein